MTAEQFIREFDALPLEDKQRVLMAIGPEFCQEVMSHPDMMEATQRWCQSCMPPAEMQDMMQRMMGQKPWR